MTKDWVHGFDHSPACQILLQIVVRAVITFLHLLGPVLLGCCRLQLTSFLSMIVLQPPLLSKGWGGHPLCPSGDSSVLKDLHWSCSCTAQSSILSIGSVSVALLRVIFLNDLGQLSLSPVSQWSSLSPVGKPSYCCSSLDFLQSHYNPLNMCKKT